MKSEHELIMCIVNAGYAETVMDAAYAYGARGGTVIQARGTANKEAEKYFSITIQPEKEILMLVVPTEIKDNILHALYKSVGLNAPGRGIAFSLPVDNVLGLSKTSAEQAESTAEDSKDEDKKDTAETKNQKSLHISFLLYCNSNIIAQLGAQGKLKVDNFAKF